MDNENLDITNKEIEDIIKDLTKFTEAAQPTPEAIPAPAIPEAIPVQPEVLPSPETVKYIISQYVQAEQAAKLAAKIKQAENARTGIVKRRRPGNPNWVKGMKRPERFYERDPVKVATPHDADSANRNQAGRFMIGNTSRKGHLFINTKCHYDLAEHMRKFYKNPAVIGRDIKRLRQIIDAGKPKEALDALRLMWSYLYGQPRQQQDINIAATQMSPEQQEEMIRRQFGLGEMSTSAPLPEDMPEDMSNLLIDDNDTNDTENNNNEIIIENNEIVDNETGENNGTV